MQLSKWHQAMDVATDRFAEPSYEDIIDVAKELFTDEMSLSIPHMVLIAQKKEIKDAMRQAVNMHEDHEGFESRQILLPGDMDAPMYLAIPSKDGDGFTPIKYSKAKKSHRVSSLEERRKTHSRIGIRIADLELKELFLDDHSISDEETVADILNRLSNSSNNNEEAA